VLALVLRELREDLRSRESRNRSMYDARHGYYWGEKREDFRRAALEMLAQHRNSGRSVTFVAEYLFRGLHAHDDAIAALLAAYRSGILEIDGRRNLCIYLQERQRWKESTPLLMELVTDQPAAADLRVMLMRAHYHLGDGPALTRTLATAEAWFRENDAWNEPVIAELAAGCLETKLFAECVEHYDEAIALHVKNAPGRGVGDGILSRYYRDQAGAYSGLGRTAEAVDAAAGAIVSWGRHINQRAQDLQRLHEVLAAAEDLEQYVQRLDAEVATTGLENPILRKTLGQVFLESGRYELAAVQLGLALDAQPDDEQTHRLLVSAYDKMKCPELAAQALLRRARLASHDVGLWAQLGRRFAALEQLESSERAFTSLVETMPEESQGHQRLAEIRQQQRRWDDAAERWRQVARVRSKEPTGYLGLARCLLQLERWDEARTVIDELLSTDWPARFGDVRAETELLLNQLRKAG
jgi:tetratricopeptide (TPR) repeat protein